MLNNGVITGTEKYNFLLITATYRTFVELMSLWINCLMTNIFIWQNRGLVNERIFPGIFHTGHDMLITYSVLIKDIMG